MDDLIQVSDVLKLRKSLKNDGGLIIKIFETLGQELNNWMSKEKLELFNNIEGKENVG